jgi:hypothetical protein
VVSAKRLGAKLMTAEVEGGLELASPLRMIGADGGIGGSGTAKGVPVSQSHNERLSGRRARPSHEGGALDQIAQPPSCHAITQMMDSRRHIVLMPLLAACRLMPAISGIRVYAVVLPNAALATSVLGITRPEVAAMVTCRFRQGVRELSGVPIAS